MAADVKDLEQKIEDLKAEVQKWKNIYSAEAVTTTILDGRIEDLQNGTLELWGINSSQLLTIINFYEAQTGEDPRKVEPWKGTK